MIFDLSLLFLSYLSSTFLGQWFFFFFMTSVFINHSDIKQSIQENIVEDPKHNTNAHTHTHKKCIHIYNFLLYKAWKITIHSTEALATVPLE